MRKTGDEESRKKPFVVSIAAIIYIEALDASCSSNHNAHSVTQTAARTHLPVLRTSKRRYNRCDSSRSERRVDGYVHVLKGGETMQLLLHLNGYLMHSTIAHIEPPDVSCSSYHNALSVTQTATRICRYYT